MRWRPETVYHLIGRYFIMGCNNGCGIGGFGGGSCLWIILIIILICCCGGSWGGCGNSCGNNCGCGGNNGCC